MEKRELTCITCPIGCRLTVDIDGREIKNVDGNACKRGIAYANAECLNPTRVLTVAVKTYDGRMLSVKTAKPIPKSQVVEAANIVYHTYIKCPVKIGDVVIHDILHTGVDIVATKQLL